MSSTTKQELVNSIINNSAAVQVCTAAALLNRSLDLLEDDLDQEELTALKETLDYFIELRNSIIEQLQTVTNN